MIRHSTILILVILSLLCAGAGRARAAGDGARPVTDDRWYMAQGNLEGRTEFHGTVRYVPPDNKPSIVMRYNAYKLELLKENPRELGVTSTLDIYTGSSDTLKPWIGKKVTIKGKLETICVEGAVFREIWPASVKAYSQPAGRK